MSSTGMDPIEAWTAYWQSGQSASCCDGGGTELALTPLWDELVDALADGARVVDLATGNGTVARQLAARARARGVRLHVEAVDAAAIDPLQHVTDGRQDLAGIRFRAGIRLESLPYAGGSFDAVVSQFGIEYADETRAFPEAARVLAPGGRMRLVMHARNGAITRDIARRLERLQSVLAQDGAAGLVLGLARAAAAGNGAELARRSGHLAQAHAQLQRLEERPLPDDAALFYAREFLCLWSRRDRLPPAEICRALEAGWRNAAGVAARQAQLLGAARSADDLVRIASRLSAHGLEIGIRQPLLDERRRTPVAWLLDARRALPPASR